MNTFAKIPPIAQIVLLLALTLASIGIMAGAIIAILMDMRDRHFVAIPLFMIIVIAGTTALTCQYKSFKQLGLNPDKTTP